jgi:hypothetical protein
MPSWILQCPHCNDSFAHSPIRAQTYLESVLPVRPKVPESGSQIRCPNCEQEFSYRSSDLTYQRDESGG